MKLYIISIYIAKNKVTQQTYSAVEFNIDWSRRSTFTAASIQTWDLERILQVSHGWWLWTAIAWVLHIIKSKTIRFNVFFEKLANRSSLHVLHPIFVITASQFFVNVKRKLSGKWRHSRFVGYDLMGGNRSIHINTENSGVNLNKPNTYQILHHFLDFITIQVLSQGELQILFAVKKIR